jgi:Ca-activated chloride channel family protein
MSMHVQTDRSLIRAAGKSVRHILLSFAAPDSPHTATRDPLNVSFVLDRSGSMGGSKIALARQAVVQALRMLRPSDRFSVVIYDYEVDVLVPSTLASPEALRNAIALVERVQARGQTNLSAGWLIGCEEVARHLQPGQTARCILLSDGLANDGIVDRGELARHAEELRARGIATSTIGLGADFDERTLEGMSRAGAGHFYFVESPVNIADCLSGELGEALEVVARDVRVLVKADSGVQVTTLNRFPTRTDADGRLVVELGELTARQDVSLVLRLRFAAGTVGQTARALFSVTDSTGVLNEPETDLIWTYADHHANDVQRRNVEVDRAAAALYAAQATAEALDLNNAGRYDEAIARLEATARRIATYADSDSELVALIGSMRERRDRYVRPMNAMDAKAEHYASMNVARMRSVEGKARRRPTS